MRKFLFPLFALAALALPARAQGTETIPRPDPSVAEFARGVKFTVAGYNGGTEVQTNFPVLVRLSTAIAGFDYGDFYNDGSLDTDDDGQPNLELIDIGFVDAAGNGLAYDIDTWNTNGESLVWVNLPRMTNGTEFAMWYRSTKTGKVLNPTNAWTDYAGVWHFREDYGSENDTVSVYDSTTNQLTGSTIYTAGQTGGQQPATLVAGKLGRVRRMGNNYHDSNKGKGGIDVILGDTGSAKREAVDKLTPAFSGSFWLYGENKFRYPYYVSRKKTDASSAWGFQSRDDKKDSAIDFGFWSKTGGNDNKYRPTLATSVSQRTWAKIDFVYTAEGTKGKGYLYKNGVPVSKVSVDLYEYAFDGDADLYIGGGSGSDSRPVIGLMDEVRLCYNVPTPARVKADFDTVDNALFLTRGTVVTNQIVERPVVNFTVADVGASHIQFGGNLSSLGSDQTTECTFYTKVWPTASSEPATWTAQGTGLGTGAFSGLVKGLAPATAYSYKLKVTNDEGDDGVDSDETDGAFTTSGVGVSGTGGDITRVGDDWIHYFRVGIDDETGGALDAYAFRPPSYASTVSALVVAGGGPGGYRAGGGGGAGGYIYNTALAVSSGTEYAIHVGTGGAASESDGSFGQQGGNSSVVGGSVNLVAVGGGAGGNGNRSTAGWRVGQSGGSGGGASGSDSAVGTGTSGQGHAGGTGAVGENNSYFGGGGGGAGSAGDVAIVSGNNVNGPGGGAGLECDITGVGLFYAGGGGAGSDELSGKPGSPGAGGSGVGGTGSRKSAGVASAATQGVDGTGSGGGGGCGDDPNFYKGGDGGDGIVIIRYASQGDPSTVPEPIVSLQSAVYDETSEDCEVSFRVAWGGYDAQAGKGYEDADVLVVWGFRKGELTHTNSLAPGVIGRGTATFRLGEQTKNVYVRVLVTNAVTGSLSPEIVKIPFLNPAAPMATVSVTATAQTTATFAANVTGLGEGATSVSGVFQVCDDEDFEDGTYITFPADGTLSAAGTLAGTASGLTYNTPYFVRASLTNNIPESFETDPVEFRTKGLGAPSGSVQNGGNYPVRVGSTMITATGYLFSPGTGATTATIRLEASTTEIFAAVAASSDDATGLGEREYATLAITGLEPETTYYLRLRMENEGRMVQRSSVIGPFTTTYPILTIPALPEHVTLVSVTTNGVAAAPVDGVYLIKNDTVATVTFGAESGYVLVGSHTVAVTMDGDTTLPAASIPTAQAIAAPATLTIPDLAPYHVTLVSVTVGGTPIQEAETANTYTVAVGDTVVVTFAVAAGYRFTGSNTATVTMDRDTTLSGIPTAELIPPPEVGQSATKVYVRKTVTLTASATDAASYRWLRNGETIEGGASGTLTVDWRSPKNHPTDAYRAVAVYDINGSTEESGASAEVTVENLPMGTVISVLAGPPPSPAKHDYSADYLAFRVLTSGTICWKAFGGLTKTIEYSVNDGKWTTITSTSDGVTIPVEAGDLVRFRGGNIAYATSNTAYSGFEGGTATYDIEGNIMSLLYGNSFSGRTDLPNKSHVFCSLFKSAPVISAENLVLPATTLKTYCYRSLFSLCTTLTKAPELPATTLAQGCYWYMFEQCAITEAPVLTANTLVNECYGHMFKECGLLDRITCFATTGFNASKCLEGWVESVAAEGTFVKAANASSWKTGDNGVPTGWIVCEEELLLPPEVSFDGETIELGCGTEGAEIRYRLGQMGDFALYTGPISITADTVVEAYSTYQIQTSPTVAETCLYEYETPFQRSNKSLTTWRYAGDIVTTPYSANAIDGHSSGYTKGTFAFDTSITLREAQPTYLWFQHADQSADIYVDNVNVGTHWGGYNAFFFDISEYVHSGRNDIRVELRNNRGNYLAPAAGDFNFNATLGNVKLFTSPVLPAMEYGYDGFHITSTVSASSATTNATINVETKVPAGASLVFTISDVNSDDSHTWTNTWTETQASTGRKQTFTTTIAGDDLHLWNGKIDPHLYTVTLEIYKDGDLYHRYERPYGFRYYEYVINQIVEGENYTGFLLNGKPYLLRGVCMHDDVEGKANALDDNDYDQEFAIIRELGCNFIRLAHYPHPKEVYDRCDRLGIIVQTEVPCVNNLKSTMPSDYYTHLATQYTDMVQQHFNHPCIVFWGLSNETTTDDASFGKEKIEGYYDLIKGLDPERMVGYVMSHGTANPSGYYNDPNVDWFGCNIYVGWYIDKTKNDPSSQLDARLNNTLTTLGKPMAFSEYGCGGTPHCHSENFKSTTTTGNNPRHDIEYQMWLHEGHIAAIRNYPQLLFTSQWQLFDIAVASRNEGFTECIDGTNVTTNDVLRRLNNKGLVERDHRTKKDTFYLYKAEWNSKDKFVHICGKDYTKTTDRVIKCYTNDGDTLSLYVGNDPTPLETVFVVDHIATFAARDFVPGVEIRVEGATTSDTVTFE